MIAMKSGPLEIRTDTLSHYVFDKLNEEDPDKLTRWCDEWEQIQMAIPKCGYAHPHHNGRGCGLRKGHPGGHWAPDPKGGQGTWT